LGFLALEYNAKGGTVIMQTSNTLLEGLQRRSSEVAWQRMVDLYSPLIRNWLKRYALMDQDSEDLVQEVLAIVVRKLPDFRRKPQIGSFRRWLRNITVNCLRDFWRAQRFRPRGGTSEEGFAGILDQLEDPESALSKFWDKEHDEYVTRRLLALIRPQFEAKTWLAFQRVALEGVSADQVAADLGLSVNAVFIAKSRVLHMLRKAGQGLID
jgi:RNA polymerase sigma-70 factor, ECF subfamily